MIPCCRLLPVPNEHQTHQPAADRKKKKMFLFPANSHGSHFDSFIQPSSSDNGQTQHNDKKKNDKI